MAVHGLAKSPLSCWLLGWCTWHEGIADISCMEHHFHQELTLGL